MFHVPQCAAHATSRVGSIRRSMWLRTAACALLSCALTPRALAIQVSTTASGVGTLANRLARPAFYDLSDLDALYSNGSLGPVELDQSVGRRVRCGLRRLVRSDANLFRSCAHGQRARS